MTFSLDDLRRWPDLEAPDLVAVDAADRLLLDESRSARQAIDTDELAIIDDGYGALTLASAAEGASGIRVHQDSLTGERALAANAGRVGMEGAFTSLPRNASLLRGARVVLLRLPRSLDALRDIAGLIAAHAAADATVFAGGRIKHMTLAMNDVLRDHFDTLDITHARQKSRVLVARGPRAGAAPEPRRAVHDGLVVHAYGGAFAGSSIDIGTRLLLAHLPAVDSTTGSVIDFACGTGVVAAEITRRNADVRVIATDSSAIAVASAQATVDANGVADRVRVVQDDLLSSVPDDSAAFIALNPPFHSGAAVSDSLAPRFFADAARVLRPGGELWTVWNSALGYRPVLERLVGPTRQIARNAKFTVTASTAR